MISRRSFLKAMAGGVVLAGALGGYAFGIEPRFRLIETRHQVRTPRFWAFSQKIGRPLKIAVLADFHACEPWMPASRIKYTVQRTNALEPDLIVLLGDYVAGLKHFRSAIVPMASWSAALSGLQAPLGTYAVLGNHDWWVDTPAVTEHLNAVGIPVLDNEATVIEHPDGGRFWLAGLGDQLAIPIGGGRFRGVDDLPGTMA